MITILISRIILLKTVMVIWDLNNMIQIIELFTLISAISNVKYYMWKFSCRKLQWLSLNSIQFFLPFNELFCYSITSHWNSLQLHFINLCAQESSTVTWILSDFIFPCKLWYNFAIYWNKKYLSLCGSTSMRCLTLRFVNVAYTETKMLLNQ